METLNFKTIITPQGDFGYFDLDIDPQDRLFIGTSSTPMLLQPTATLEMAKKQYNGLLLSRWDMDDIDTDNQDRFDWDTHTPDWKLVDIEVNVKDEVGKS